MLIIKENKKYINAILYNILFLGKCQKKITLYLIKSK